MMTPFQLRWALVFASGGEAWTEIDWHEFDSPVGQETKLWLLKEGLIHGDDRRWGDPTDRLLAYIEHLCAQPLPVCKWVTEPPCAE